MPLSFRDSWCVLFLAFDSEHPLIDFGIQCLRYSPQLRLFAPEQCVGGGVKPLEHLNIILWLSFNSFYLRMYPCCALPILEKYRYPVFETLWTGSSEGRRLPCVNEVCFKRKCELFNCLILFRIIFLTDSPRMTGSLVKITRCLDDIVSILHKATNKRIQFIESGWASVIAHCTETWLLNRSDIQCRSDVYSIVGNRSLLTYRELTRSTKWLAPESELHVSLLIRSDCGRQVSRVSLNTSDRCHRSICAASAVVQVLWTKYFDKEQVNSAC